MSDAKDRAALKTLAKRADKARNFPTNTDGCSRHAYIIAESMVRKHGYPMLAEEPVHCAISIMATVAALWEARNALAALEAKQASDVGKDVKAKSTQGNWGQGPGRDGGPGGAG